MWLFIYFGTWLGPGNGLHLVVYLVMPWICGWWFCHLVGSGSDLDMSLMYFELSLTCQTIWTCNSEWIYDVMDVSTSNLLDGFLLISICNAVMGCILFNGLQCVLWAAMCHVKTCRIIWQQHFTTIFCPTWHMYSHLRSIFLWCFLYMITAKIERRKSTTYVWSSQNYDDNISFVAEHL